MAVDFRELMVWNEAMLLAEQVYGLSGGFPADERFGMCAQVRRASVSVPSCIAEGNARSGTRDYLRFLSMAAGSLAEVQTQLLLAEGLRFVHVGAAEPVLRQVGVVTRLLQALCNSLEAKISEEPGPFSVPCPPFPASA